MNINTLKKLIKAIKIIAIVIPLVAIATSIAGSINQPGGDPIEDDPVPI